MKYILLLISMLFVSVSQANYYKGGLGYSISGESKFTTGGLTATADHKSRIAFPMLLAYGYEYLDFLTFEGELSLRTNNFKEDAYRNDIGVYNLAANAIGNYPMGDFNAFLGLGVAYSLYRIGSESGYGAGAQGFVGVDYKTANNIRFGLEYRYFTTVQDVKINDVDTQYNNSSVLLSAKFLY